MAQHAAKNNETSGELSRVERRQQRTRANLIDAARKLTGEKGVEGLTIRDITSEADIAMGGFYQYFESKDALLEEAFQQIVFQSGETIDRINRESNDPIQVVATAFTTFERMIQSDPILGWFIVRVSSYNPEWANTLYDRFVRDLNAGIDDELFDVPHVPVALNAVGASLFGFYRARLLGELGEETVPHFVHLMLRMLGAQETAALNAAERAWSEVRNAVDAE